MPDRSLPLQPNYRAPKAQPYSGFIALNPHLRQTTRVPSSDLQFWYEFTHANPALPWRVE